MANENSVFSNTPTEDDNTNPENTDLNFDDIKVDTLVGDDKKYKTADELAKAYAHSDAYIARMKEERAEEKARLKVLEEMLEARQNNKSENPAERNTPNSEENNNQRSNNAEPENRRSSEENNSEEDFETRFKELYEKTQEEKTFAKNVDSVATRLTEQMGSSAAANKFVREKANELNVSVDWLMDMAGRSPAALYRTIGIEGTASQNSPNANADKSINGPAFRKDSSSNKRNFRYYEDIRKSNPNQFYKSTTQAQMLKDAREQGSEFYNS